MYGSNGVSTFHTPSGKGAADFFIRGESPSISRRNSYLNGSTKTCLLDYVIPGSIRGQVFSQGMDFLAYRLTAFAHGIVSFQSDQVLKASSPDERTLEYGKLSDSSFVFAA
jgi:hypothetical protein